MNASRRVLPLLAATVLLAACAEKAAKSLEAGDTSAAKPVATVNGTAISKEMLEYFVEASANQKFAELSPEQQKQALDQLIEMHLLAQKAQGDGADKDAATKARVDLARINVLGASVAQELMAGPDPTEAELKAEYDAQIAQLPKFEYRARHILVDDEALAKDLIAQLDKGADFAELAGKNSKDPGSASQGGDLDWFAPGRMVKPFADAVQGLTKGTYTKAPVQSQFGWHVIKLEDTRDAQLPPFEAVKDQIPQMVKQRRVQKLVDDLKAKAKIERNL